VAYLLKANLRVNGGEFEKTLQDDQDLTTGDSTPVSPVPPSIR